MQGATQMISIPVALPTRLNVSLRLEINPSYILTLSGLVDTGCETNLIRRGIVPDSFFHPARNPINFVAANNTSVIGGQRDLFTTIHFDALDQHTGLHHQVQIPSPVWMPTSPAGILYFHTNFWHKIQSMLWPDNMD